MADHQPQSGELSPARVANQASWLISRAYARSNALLNAGFELHADGLRKYHYRLLAALEQSGPTSQVELGRGTSVDRSDVVAVLDELQARGLVNRAPDPNDRRRNIVSITAAGTKQLQALDHMMAEIQAEILAPIPMKERERFLTMLQALGTA